MGVSGNLCIVVKDVKTLLDGYFTVLILFTLCFNVFQDAVRKKLIGHVNIHYYSWLSELQPLWPNMIQYFGS